MFTILIYQSLVCDNGMYDTKVRHHQCRKGFILCILLLTTMIKIKGQYVRIAGTCMSLEPCNSRQFSDKRHLSCPYPSVLTLANFPNKG
jgi:hypothetical protein